MRLDQLKTLETEGKIVRGYCLVKQLELYFEVWRELPVDLFKYFCGYENQYVLL